MLKMKLQYFGHLMRRTDSLEKTLMLGKIEGFIFYFNGEHLEFKIFSIPLAITPKNKILSYISG